MARSLRTLRVIFSSYTAIQSQHWSSQRDNERHYKTMSLEALAALPVKDLVSPDGCHLFIWTSGPFLLNALHLIEAWGFRYSTRASWLKTKRNWDGIAPLAETDFHIGLGLTVRHQTEFVLLARRGNCRRRAKDVRELIVTPRREHSRKPDEFFRRVERWAHTSTCSRANGAPAGTSSAMNAANSITRPQRRISHDRG